MLLQLTIITPWLVKVVSGTNQKSKKVLWFVTPIYLMYVYAWNYWAGSQPRLYETLFPAWFLFYYLGIQIRSGMKWHCNGIAVILAFLISCAEAFLLWITGAELSFYISQITFGSFLYSVIFIGWLFKLYNKHKDKNYHLLEQFGNCSYGVFYIHMFILMVVSKVLAFLSINNWIINSVFRFGCTAALSLIVVRLVNHALHKKKYGVKILRSIGFQ